MHKQLSDFLNESVASYQLLHHLKSFEVSKEKLLRSAMLKIYNLNTRTPKDIYSLTHHLQMPPPIVASANGNFPDIWFAGSASVQLLDRNRVAIGDVDIVDSKQERAKVREKTVPAAAALAEKLQHYDEINKLLLAYDAIDEFIDEYNALPELSGVCSYLSAFLGRNDGELK